MTQVNVKVDVKTKPAAPSSNKTLSQQFSSFVAASSYAKLPDDAKRAATLLILDGVGIALASNRFEFAEPTLRGLQVLGGGDGVIIGRHERLSLRDAAIMNGVLIHGLDFDDTHLEGVIHVTASCFPTVLAVAAQMNRSVEDMLTAFALGIEVAARVGMIAKGELGQIGFHPTGAVAAFGTAVAAGYLYGLTEQQLTMAQGIALSMASGTSEFHTEGAWTKRLHPGWAAAAGITAAALAKGGFVGPLSPYEGKRGGFFLTHLGNHGITWDATDAAAGLGQRWEVTQVALKPSPACQHNIACIDAATALARAHKLDFARIVKVEAVVTPHAVKVVCEPAEKKKRPHSSYAAQFSLQFTVACALMRGRFGLKELEFFSDEAIRALADKVEYRVDPNTNYPQHFAGEVIVHYDDGTQLRHREEINRGAAIRPLTLADVTEKFDGNAQLALPKTEAARIYDAVVNMPYHGSARAFADALASDGKA